MKDHHQNAIPKNGRSEQPCAVLGAANLASILWKEEDPDRGFRYEFNVFRMDRETGEVGRLFGPDDLLSFVKLTRLLAAVLLDDGWLADEERQELCGLVMRLDGVLDPTALPPINAAIRQAVRRIVDHLLATEISAPDADSQPGQLLDAAQALDAWLNITEEEHGSTTH